MHVPSLWPWELLNVIAVTTKRRRIGPERATEFLAQFVALNLKIDRPPQATDFLRLHALAAAHGLTAYDVAYLDLAKRLRLPLATRDRALSAAARAEGVTVLGA